jgi:hypothetical protein
MASNHPTNPANPAEPANLTMETTSSSAEPSEAEMAPSNTSSSPVLPPRNKSSLEVEMLNKFASIRKQIEDAIQDLEEWQEEQGITTDSEPDSSLEEQQSDPSEEQQSDASEE